MLELRRKNVRRASKILLTYAYKITVSAPRPAAVLELPIRMRAGADAARATMGAEIELP